MNNYHQTFIVCLMTYIHVKLTLFVIYLYCIKNMFKRARDKTNMIFRRHKNQNKIYKRAKSRIK